MAFPLNPAQKAAVEHPGGPLLIIAGAGSGKTRVITQRIARLIEQGVPAKSIFAVTFTNKASQEMAERLEHQVGKHHAEQVWMSTFHALGAEILRLEAKHVAGGDKFVVYDAADQLGVVKEILRDLKVTGKGVDAGAVVSRISHAKNALTSPDKMDHESEYDELAARAFPRYTAQMKRLNALDFDDLILVPLRIVSEVKEVQERWHHKMRYLLVDEFQDTSRAQLLFVKELAGPRKEVFCVGDDDQSIYGWRGAELKNILEFDTYFPGSKMVALEQNYRSRQPVLDVANASIAPAKRVYPKKLFSDKKQGELPVLVECDTNESETTFVFETIKKALNDGLKRSDIAVLYRSNSLCKPIEEVLKLNSIPHKIIGGTSTYERREVKDLTSYLRLAVNHEDDIAFRRVVNYPTRGVGDTSFERIERHAKARGKPMLEACREPVIKDLDPKVKHSLDKFIAVIDATRAKVDGVGLLDTAKWLSSEIGLHADIVAAGPSANIATKRWANIEFLYKTFERANARTLKEAKLVLTKLALRFGEEDEDEGEQVILSTLHGSKGLEFSLVFLLGCDEGIMPHSRVDNPKATDILSTIDASEERRLFYVGVTRAKDTLYLTRARMRALKGSAKPTAPSRFLRDIPAELMTRRTYAGAPIMANADMAARARAAREALAAMSKLKGGTPPAR